MQGRPPLPIAVKRAQGDTRQRGALKHEASVANSYEARRGRPDMPTGLSARARKHWLYLAEQLESEKLLTPLDEGAITMSAVAYDGALTAAKSKNWLAFDKLAQRYMAISDRIGTNESARARFPKRGDAAADPLMAAMCG